MMHQHNWMMVLEELKELKMKTLEEVLTNIYILTLGFLFYN